tara:strand:- start:1255 stop:1968 length:714 start_codon:yes stop_codon:yes gene_type:complete
MLFNKELIINNNNYNNNIIWGYIDIYKGNIILYSPELCRKIEYYYKNNKSFINIDNIVIYFKNKLKQTINNKKYSVFRIIANQNIIKKTLCIKNNFYYIYKKQNHIGLLIDNIKNIDNYKSIILNIIYKHKNQSSNNRLYINNIYNNKNIKNINNLDIVFPTFPTNSIFTQFITLLVNISNNYYTNETVYLYILTNTYNFNILNEIYNNLLAKSLINKNYILIPLLNTINDLEYVYI